MLNQIKGICGNGHTWVFIANFGITAISVGIAWGTLSAGVSALRYDFEQFSLRQEVWNAQESKTDDVQRDRMNAIQEQIFQMLRDRPKQ